MFPSFGALCSRVILQGCPRQSPCSPARISASSMNWVLNRITRPARCSRRRLHTWCLERGSSPAVGSSRNKTCRKDGIRHSSLLEQLRAFGVWCSEGKRPRASFEQGQLFCGLGGVRELCLLQNVTGKVGYELNNKRKYKMYSF